MCALFKNFLIQWWVQIFEYLNKMTLEYYSYSYSCYFQSTNLFGYSFGKYMASEYIWIFVWYIMWHPNIFGYSFVSILWYSLITVSCSGVSCVSACQLGVTVTPWLQTQTVSALGSKSARYVRQSDSYRGRQLDSQRWRQWDSERIRQWQGETVRQDEPETDMQ